MPANIFSPRQIVAYATVVLVFFLADPQTPTFIAGCLVAVVGVGFRVWGCGHLRKNKDLITTGPYAYVKHPLYLGTFLVSCGGIIAAGSPESPARLPIPLHPRRCRGTYETVTLTSGNPKIPRLLSTVCTDTGPEPEVYQRTFPLAATWQFGVGITAAGPLPI